jgi:hypothetical protein
MTRRYVASFSCALMLTTAFANVLTAQAPGPAPSPAGSRKPLTIADYSRWRNIEGASISPDGRWVAYTLRHANTLPADSRPALRLLNLETNQDVEVPNAHDAEFSSNSRWVVYQVDSVPPPRGGRGTGSAAPPAA